MCYKNASRYEKYLILDKFCAPVLRDRYHRKQAIPILKRFKQLKKLKAKKRGISAIYQNDEDILKSHKQIRLAANLLCSKRLKAVLPLWLPENLIVFSYVSHSISQTQSLEKVIEFG